jgi:hypothetical protein
MMLLHGSFFHERLVPAFVAKVFLVVIESGYLAQILIFGALPAYLSSNLSTTFRG